MCGGGGGDLGVVEIIIQARLVQHHAHRAAHRVRAIQRALRAAQDFDALDVEQLRIHHGHWRFIEIEGRRRYAVEAGFDTSNVHATSTAQVVTSAGRRSDFEAHARHAASVVEEVVHAGLHDRFLSERRDADGHILQPFLTALAGSDGHLFQDGCVVGFGLRSRGGSCGSCESARCGRHCGGGPQGRRDGDDGDAAVRCLLIGKTRPLQQTLERDFATTFALQRFGQAIASQIGRDGDGNSAHRGEIHQGMVQRCRCQIDGVGGEAGLGGGRQQGPAQHGRDRIAQLSHRPSLSLVSLLL